MNNNFISNLVHDGEIFNVYRGNKYVSRHYAIWENPLSSGKLHLVFFGEINLQTSDVLKSENEDNFFNLDTYVESYNSKPYKRHVFCETETDYNNRKHDKKIQEIKYWVPVVVSNIIALAALFVTVIYSID